MLGELAEADDRERDLRHLPARVGAASLRLWPAAAPLLGLPFASRPVSWGLVAASALVGALRTRTEPGTREAAAPWPLALLGLAMCLSIWYVAVGSTMAGNVDNDSAYYFGMARHFVQSHRFDEPIVWQFLVKPASVVHRPFDYWPGFLPLVLTPILALFGASHHVAGVFMGAVSAAGVVAFAYLVGVAAPVRSRAVQLVAVLLFALSPALVQYRFDTETIPFVHLWLVLALIAFARRRLVTSALLAFVMFLSRSDTIVLAALVWGALVVAAIDARAPRRVAQIARGERASASAVKARASAPPA